MRSLTLSSILVLMFSTSYAVAQEELPPDGFLTTDEIVHLLKFENFDDLHSLEDSDGNRIKALHENTPFLAETYKGGNYAHYDEDGETDTAKYYVKDNSLCLTWEWTNNEKLESSNGKKECFYIEQRGNCYLPQYKSRWARPNKEIKSTTFIFVRYGENPECSQKIS